jgi:glucose dehydrogenase
MSPRYTHGRETGHQSHSLIGRTDLEKLAAFCEVPALRMHVKDIPDVCIIGAGLVGGLMAYELARRGLTVVVLEAGPVHDLRDRSVYMADLLSGRISGRPFASNLPERDVHSNAGEVKYPLNDLRVKAVGGSTLHWGAQTLRFIESDFRLKTLYGIADDWPITYDELEPFYTKAEQALGVAGAADNPFASKRTADFPLPAFPFSLGDKLFQAACRSLGIVGHSIPWARNSIPYQDRPACMAFGTCGTKGICPIAAQYTAETHVGLATATANATVIANANVVRLLTDDQRRITSAIYMNREKKENRQDARMFVLAAHTVETARLLLLSESSQFPHGLANGSGMVGKNFMERPAIAVQGIVEQPVFPYRIGFPTMETMQFCNPKNRQERAGIKLEFHNFSGPRPSAIAAPSGNWGKALADEVRQSFGHEISVEAAIEQLPDPGNAVSLDPDLRDCFGDPAPRITYSFGAYEKTSLEEAIKLARQILAATGAEVDGGEVESGFAGHPMGTCRMGNDPDTSVVDRNLRAHEVSNLFIVGASAFVTGSSLQPSTTIAALAIRAAEHIAGGKG